MSQSAYVLEMTYNAAADLSAKQYKIVKQSAAGVVNISTAGTDKHLGVLQNKPLITEAANVRVLGSSKVVAGGTVTLNAWVTADANGDAIATVTDKDVVVGMALEAAVDNDIFEILLTHFTLSA